MGSSILVIDDDSDDQLLLKEVLNEVDCNASIYCATDGFSGLQLLKQLGSELPSLVVLDFNMPELNGLEVLKKIKERYDVPVLLYTTHCSAELVQKAKGNGAVDCIKKPDCNRDFLKVGNLIKRLLKN